MKETVKEILFLPVRIALKYVRLLGKVWPGVKIQLDDTFYAETQQKTGNVLFRGGEEVIELVFHTPNEVCRYRVETFETKEPETLQWLEKYGGGVFYDVGANVGLFSVFYAKKFSMPVYAFEPSALNLGQLAKNISINQVNKDVVIVPIPLSREFVTSDFELSMLDEGGSMSHFGLREDSTDCSPAAQMVYKTVGVPLDYLVGDPFNFPLPSLLKIDVDGLEAEVLMGAKEVLRCEELKSVLIEVDESFPKVQYEIEGLLLEAGLSVVSKERSSMFDNTKFENSYNQVWVRGN